MKIKGFFKALWKMIKHNFWQKMIALLFAFIFWSYILVQSNPTRRREIRHMKVNYVGAEELEARHLMVTGGFDGDFDVSAVIEAEQNDHRYINANNVTVKADLSSITAEGEVTVGLSVDTKYGLVKSVYPSSIKLSTERIIERQVPLTYEYIGEPAEGCYVAPPEFNVDSVTIKGAQSVVERVTEARCYISIVGIDKTITKSYSTTLLNYSGKKVEFTNEIIGGAPYAAAKIEVSASKRVPIETSLLGINVINLPENYEISKLTAEPESILISGDKALLDTIETLNISELNLKGKTGEVAVNAVVEKLDGVNYVEPRTITVKANVTEQKITRVFKNVAVYKKNGDEKSVSGSYIDVYVTGGAIKVNGLTAADIVVYVDITGLMPGKYTIIPESEPIEGIVIKPASTTVEIIIE